MAEKMKLVENAVCPVTGLQQESSEQETERMDDTGEVEDVVMSHKDAMSQLQSGLSKIIQEDPLLCDLPKQVTLDEIKSKIALEYGQAMIVNVRKANEELMPVVVVQGANVRELKNAIKRYVILKLEREEIKKSINWTYIWKSYWLYFDGQRLEDDNKPIKEYGIRNKDEVTFMRRLQQK